MSPQSGTPANTVQPGNDLDDLDKIIAGAPLLGQPSANSTGANDAPTSGFDDLDKLIASAPPSGKAVPNRQGFVDRELGAPLSPVLALANKYISSKIPNPSLASVGYGFQERAIKIGEATQDIYNRGVRGNIKDFTRYALKKTAMPFGEGVDISGVVAPAVSKGIDWITGGEEPITKEQQITNEVRKETESERLADYQSRFKSDKLGEAVGDIALLGAVSRVFPYGKTSTLGSTQQVTRAMQNAINAGMTLFVSTPGTLQEKMDAAKTAAIAAPLLQGAIENAAIPFVKKVPSIYRWAKSSWTEKPVISYDKFIVEAKSAGYNSVDDLMTASAKGEIRAKYLEEKMLKSMAKEKGIPLSFSDYTDKAMVERVATSLEGQPGVMSGFRKKQSQDITKALGKDMENRLTSAGEMEFKYKQNIAKAAKSGDKEAQDTLAKMETAGDSPESNIIASLYSSKWNGQKEASAAYDEVARLVEGRGEVDLSKPIKTIENILHNQESVSLSPNDELISELRKRLTLLLDPARPKTYTNIRKSIKGIGNSAYLLKDNKEASSVLLSLKEELGDVLDDWASSSGIPGAKKAVEKAKSIWMEKSRPFKDPSYGLMSMMESLTPDVDMKPFLQKQSADKFRMYYDRLDPKGQEYAKALFFRQAVEDATTGSNAISPLKFSSYILNRAKTIGVAFDEHDKWFIEGGAQLFRRLQRAGQYAENPATGLRGAREGVTLLKHTGLGASLYALSKGNTAEAAMYAMPAITSQVYGQVMSRLYTTPGGKAFLESLGKMKPGQRLSKAAQDLISKLTPSTVEPLAKETPQVALPTLGYATRKTPSLATGETSRQVGMAPASPSLGSKPTPAIGAEPIPSLGMKPTPTLGMSSPYPMGYTSPDAYPNARVIGDRVTSKGYTPIKELSMANPHRRINTMEVLDALTNSETGSKGLYDVSEAVVSLKKLGYTHADIMSKLMSMNGKEIKLRPESIAEAGAKRAANAPEGLQGTRLTRATIKR